MNALTKAIRDKLVADETLAATVTGGWHTPVAPAGTTYPYGVIQKVSGVDGYALSQRIAVRYLYQVRIIGQGPTVDTIGTALARVDALLTRAVLSVSGYSVGCSQRTGDLPDMTVMGANDVPLSQVGATYEFWVTAA